MFNQVLHLSILNQDVLIVSELEVVFLRFLLLCIHFVISSPYYYLNMKRPFGTDKLRFGDLKKQEKKKYNKPDNKKATFEVALLLLRKRLLHKINYSFESCNVVQSQVGKYFAVEFYIIGV